MAQDHYETLGVLPTANAADLRSAYLKLARAHHPDKFVGAERDKAQTRMMNINEAWNVLGVAHKRKEYDSTHRRVTPRSEATPGNSKARRGHAHFKPFDDDPIARADIDLDPNPLATSKGMPRWLAFVPVLLVGFGVTTLGFGTMVGASMVLKIGGISLIPGVLFFLMLPLWVMSRAARDPDV